MPIKSRKLNGCVSKSKKSTQNNNRMSSYLKHHKNCKPKQCLDDIVRQIDKIKFRLSKMKDSSQYYPKPQLNHQRTPNKLFLAANQIKTQQCQFIASPYRLQTQSQYNFSSINKKMTNSNSVYLSVQKQHNNGVTPKKGSKKPPLKKISTQLKRLQQFTKNLVLENQILENKLFCEKSQKIQLKKLLQTCKIQNSIRSPLIITPQNLKHHQVRKESLISLDSKYNNSTSKALTRPSRKDLSQSKENALCYDMRFKDISANASIMTQIRDYRSFPNRFSDYNQSDLNILASQFKFKQYDSPVESKNESMLLDYIEPQFGNSFGKNIIKSKDMEVMKKEYKQSQRKLQKLQEQFNELISLSRLEKSKGKKTEIRKQLSQIAHQIRILKNKVPIY